MGLVFLDTVDHFPMRCSMCSVHVCSSSDIVQYGVVTENFLAFVVDSIVNCMCVKTKGVSQLSPGASGAIFDPNCVLESHESKQAYDICCKKCNCHVGWKHGGLYIIKTASVISSLCT